MTSGRIFFFINKCELYIIVKKKNGPLLVVLIHSVYGRVSERKGRKKKNRKNKLYLLTFRVGNAIPALGSSALGSVNTVTAAPVPPSALPQRSVEKHSLNSSSFLLSLLQIHALQVHVATVKLHGTWLI